MKYKARLEAKRYSQKYAIDYDEVYALVAKFDSIRVLIAIATQFDVKSFLNGCY